MGQTTAEAVRQIEETRRRLDSELEELETFLPPAGSMTKRALAVLGGLLASTAILTVYVRSRGQRKEQRRLRSIDRRLEHLEELLDGSGHGRRRRTHTM